MNTKKTLILVVVAVILCAIVFLPQRGGPPSNGGGAASSESTALAASASIFQKVSPDTLAAIEIFAPGAETPLRLEKSAGEWKIRDGERLYAIDKYALERLTGPKDKPELKGPLTLELQARNPETHEAFDLTSAKARRVKFYDAKGELLEDLLLGKAGADWQTTFVRRPDEKEVYLAPVRLADNFTGDDVNSWRDKRLFPTAEVDKVTWIHVDDRENTRTCALQRTDPPVPPPEPGSSILPTPAASWRVLAPYQADAQSGLAQSLVRSIATASFIDSVKAEDVPASAFDTPGAIVSFRLKDDPTTFTLTLSREIPGKARRIYAKTNISDELYEMVRPFDPFRDPSLYKVTPTPVPTPSEDLMGPPAPPEELPAPQVEPSLEESQPESSGADTPTTPGAPSAREAGTQTE